MLLIVIAVTAYDVNFSHTIIFEENESWKTLEINNLLVLLLRQNMHKSKLRQLFHFSNNEINKNVYLLGKVQAGSSLTFSPRR